MRRHCDDDSGVTPVLGIILMVAITVSLAAGAFVMVGNAGSETSASPNVSFQTHRGGTGGDIIVVGMGTTTVPVEELTINPASCILLDAGGNPKYTGNLEAADYVSCPDDGEVSIVDGASKTVIYSGTV